MKLLPVGFLPAAKPSWGARASICAGVTDDDDDGLADGTIEELALVVAGVTDGVDLADRPVGVPALVVVGVTGGAELADGAVRGPALLFVDACDDDGGDALVGGAAVVLALLIAAACSWNVVDAIGQPFPGPLRFCSVSLAALRRASWDALESSSGKERGTVGLLRT